MEKVLVDTDVIIDFLRIDSGLFPKLLRLQAEGKIEIFLSSITVMELYAGASAGKQESLLSDLVSQFRVLPFDKELAKVAGELKRGKRLSASLADYIIGVTTIAYKARLVTRNRKHFESISKLRFYQV